MTTEPPLPRDVLLRFGVFELDLQGGALRRQGRRVELAPQPFQLLALLRGLWMRLRWITTRCNLELFE